MKFLLNTKVPYLFIYLFIFFFAKDFSGLLVGLRFQINLTVSSIRV